MGLGRKMCKYKVVQNKYTGYYRPPPYPKPGELGYESKTTIRCKNPNAPASFIMNVDIKYVVQDYVHVIRVDRRVI